MAEVRGFNPQAEDTGREGGFIKEVTFLSRGKKAVKKREVPIGATVSGEINEPTLKQVPRETVKEPSVIVTDYAERGQDKELSSVPMSVTVSKERMDAFNSMNPDEIKEEMHKITKEYESVKREYDTFKGIIETRRKSAKIRPEDEGRKKKLLDAQVGYRDWLKSNYTKMKLLEAEWNMLNDLKEAKEKIEEAA